MLTSADREGSRPAPAQRNCPPRPFLARRWKFAGFAEAIAALTEVARRGARRIPERLREALVVVAHSDFDDEALDLEIGFALTEDRDGGLALPSGGELVVTELPAAEHLATLVRSGPAYESHLGYGALGLWMQANRFEIHGPCREVFLQTPFEGADPDNVVVEIQFPVRRA